MSSRMPREPFVQTGQLAKINRPPHPPGEEPEKLTTTRAAPCGGLLKPSRPDRSNENDFKGTIESEAAIFCATIVSLAYGMLRGAWMRLSWISDIWNKRNNHPRPDIGPTRTCKNWFTSSRPCSLGTERKDERLARPRLSHQVAGWNRETIKLKTRSLPSALDPSIKSNFHAAPREHLLRVSSQASPNSGKITGPECTSITATFLHTVR